MRARTFYLPRQIDVWSDVAKTYTRYDTRTVIGRARQAVYSALKSDNENWSKIGKGYKPQVLFQKRDRELNVTFEVDERNRVQDVKIKDMPRKSTLKEFGIE